MSGHVLSIATLARVFRSRRREACARIARRRRGPFGASVAVRRDISLFSPKIGVVSAGQAPLAWSRRRCCASICVFTGRSSDSASSPGRPSQPVASSSAPPMALRPGSASQQRSCRRFSLRSLFSPLPAPRRRNEAPQRAAFTPSKAGNWAPVNTRIFYCEFSISSLRSHCKSQIIKTSPPGFHW